MAFKQFSKHARGVELLQRSLARGRLGHAYLFAGDLLDELEALARTLAKTLSCRNSIQTGGAATDCCDECLNCRTIDKETHADVHWARPESKSRVITIDQTRDLMREIQLKPTGAEFKVAVIVAADRMNVQAANAFLKTLEEPPPRSVLILLSTEPQRLLETILSRCLRLNFFGDGKHELSAAEAAWLEKFGALAAGEQKTLLGRYRLLDVLLQRLGEIRERVNESLSARSPLQKYDDVEKALREKWEDELAAATEAEYRRQRADLLLLVQWWLRDVWLQTLAAPGSAVFQPASLPPTTRRQDAGAPVKRLLNFPKISGAEAVAAKLSPRQALENLQTLEQTQRLLRSNVQEALALEVGMLKLHF